MFISLFLSYHISQIIKIWNSENMHLNNKIRYTNLCLFSVRGERVWSYDIWKAFNEAGPVAFIIIPLSDFVAGWSTKRVVDQTPLAPGCFAPGHTAAHLDSWSWRFLAWDFRKFERTSRYCWAYHVPSVHAFWIRLFTYVLKPPSFIM